MAKKDTKSKGVLGDDPFASLDLSWLEEESSEPESVSSPEESKFSASPAREQSQVLKKPGYFVALTRGSLSADVCAHQRVDPPLFSWLYPRGEDLKLSEVPPSKPTLLSEQLPSPIRGRAVQVRSPLSKRNAVKNGISAAAPTEDARLLNRLFSDDGPSNEPSQDAVASVSEAEVEVTLQNWLVEDEE